jgi:hypothetical protein
MAFADTVKFTAGSSGTSDFSDGTALTGFRSLSTGAVSGQTYSYRAFSADLSQWENGQGVYTSGSPGTLTRATVYESSTGSKINFTTAPVVILTPLKADLDLLFKTADFTGDSGSGGVHGLVPAPAAGDAAAGKVLGAGGGWVGGPGLVFLTSGTVSSSATLNIDLSNYMGYAGIRIDLYEIVPATATSNLWCRFSADGSTYDSGASNYAYQKLIGNITDGGGSPGSTGDTKIEMFTNMNAAAAGRAIVEIFDHNNSGINQVMEWSGSVKDNSSHYYRYNGMGQRLTNQIVKAIQFFQSSGNISLKYRIYGYV